MTRDTSLTDLRSLLAALRRERQVLEVTAEVDPRLEIAEIHRRVVAAGGPVLVFRRVRGAHYPVVTNLFGSALRVERAFGPEPRALISRAAELPRVLLPPAPGRLWGQRDLFWRLLRVGTKRAPSAPVLDVVERPARLTRLPALTTWAKDGGPFITLGQVYTEHPNGLGHNLGLYRMQVFDDSTTGMHWQIAKGGGFHHAAAEALGETLPVAVFLGGPPALLLAAVAPLPENVPELLLASLVMGRRLRQARLEGFPLPLVADAEFALLGRVPPRQRRPEGPFGDHYGYYSLAHDYPVFQVEAISRRKDALYPATVVGKPRQEDFYIGDFLQHLLSPLFPVVMPAVRDLWSYGETGYHSLSAAVVHQRYRREAMAAAFRVLGEGQLSLTKFLLVLDRPCDLRDFRTDLYVFANLSMDSLDYAGPRINEGSKGVLLGVGEPIRDLPQTFDGPLPPGITEARVFCPGCLVLRAPRFPRNVPQGHAAPDVAPILAHPALAAWPLVVLADDAARATRSAFNFLWTTFTRFEPAADLHGRAVTLLRNHPAFESPIAIDARMKPWYPEELLCDPGTAGLVNRRWKEYFPGGGVEMGDSDRGSLD